MADECPALAHWHTGTLAHWYMYRWHLTAPYRCRYSHGMPNTRVIADTFADTPTAPLPLPIVAGKPRPAYADGSLRSPIDYWIDLADYHSQSEPDIEMYRR